MATAFEEIPLLVAATKTQVEPRVAELVRLEKEIIETMKFISKSCGLIFFERTQTVARQKQPAASEKHYGSPQELIFRHTSRQTNQTYCVCSKAHGSLFSQG